MIAVLFAATTWLGTLSAAAGPPGLAPPAPEARGGRDARAPLAPGLIEEVRLREGEVLEEVARFDPQRHEQLLRLRERDERAYLHALVRISRTMEQARTDPAFAERLGAMRDLDRQLQELASEHRSATAARGKEIRARMVELTTELFEAKQAERRARLEELAARMKELEAEIGQREGDRARVIDAYVEGLLGAPPGL